MPPEEAEREFSENFFPRWEANPEGVNESFESYADWREGAEDEMKSFHSAMESLQVIIKKGGYGERSAQRILNYLLGVDPMSSWTRSLNPAERFASE